MSQGINNDMTASKPRHIVKICVGGYWSFFCSVLLSTTSRVTRWVFSPPN